MYLGTYLDRGPKKKIVQTGLPQLMVIHEDHVKGGIAADSAVKKVGIWSAHGWVH